MQFAGDRIEDGRLQLCGVDGDVVEIVDAVHAVVYRDQYVVLRARRRRPRQLCHHLHHQGVVVEYLVVVQRISTLHSHAHTIPHYHSVYRSYRHALGRLETIHGEFSPFQQKLVGP